MKHIATNFSKLDMFGGMDFKRWQKKMPFFLTGMSLVYVLSTPFLDNGDDASMEQIRCDNRDLSRIHMRIEESLRAQEIDKPKRNNIVGSSSVVWWNITTPLERENEVLELIHSDPCDLHATPSLGNTKYFLTFINDASRFCYVYILHTQDEALDKFKVFNSKVELQQGALMKRFRTDRGETRDEVCDRHSYCFNVEEDPKIFDDAMKYEDVAFWKEAINDEMKSIVLGCWLIYHLVANLIDYFDNYASVTRMSTIRLLIALSSIHHMSIHQMDMKTTIFTCELDEDVYMNQPQCFIMPVSTHIDTSEKLRTNNGQTVSQLEYSRVIGCLMYAMAYTRPDIAFIVGKLSSYIGKAYSHMYNGKSRHWVFDEEPEAPKEAAQSLRQTPPSPDYMPGLEHPPSPDYIPGLEYLEYVVPSDDEVPIKDQPQPADASPTALSPGYVADSDPSEEDPEEDPADYHVDGGDDDDDEEEEDEEEEEEHIASADSTTLPAIDPIPSIKDTKVFKTDESAPTLPSSPIHTSPTYADAPLGYKATMIRSRATSPPRVPSSILHRARIFDVPEADVPHRKRLCLTAPAPRFEVGESSVAVSARQPGLDVNHATEYSFVDTDIEERVPTTLEELSQRVTDLATTLARDTHEMRYHLHTAMLLESEARHTRQAWSQAIDCNRAVHAELLAYRAEGNVVNNSGSHEILYACENEGNTIGIHLYDWRLEKVDKDEVHNYYIIRGRCVVYVEKRKAIIQYMFIEIATIEEKKGTNTTKINKSCLRGSTPTIRIFTLKKMPPNRTATTTPTTTMIDAQIKALIARGVADALQNVKGTDVLSYNQRFQELALMCGRTFPEESGEVEKYVGDLPDMIYDSVMASKPKTMQDAIEFATELVDQKIRTIAERQAEKKKV
ncbi:putative reverse transcriptase domain-containing protein [Tanacetum coccineum]